MNRETSQLKLLYNDPLNTLELVACQLANAVGIIAGIGILPILYKHPVPLWLVAAVVGMIVMAVGLFFLEQRRGYLQGFLSRLAAGLSQTWDWARSRLTRKGKIVESPVESEKPVGAQEQPEAPSPEIPTSQAADHNLYLQPYLTVMIGAFIMLPGVLLVGTRHLSKSTPLQVAIYFSAPALLIWMVGELVNMFLKLADRPRSSAVIVGMLKSGLQAIGGAILWVTLGLAFESEVHPWLLWSAAGFVLVGLVLGFGSQLAESRQRKARLQNIPGGETAG